MAAGGRREKGGGGGGTGIVAVPDVEGTGSDEAEIIRVMPF